MSTLATPLLFPWPSYSPCYHCLSLAIPFVLVTLFPLLYHLSAFPLISPLPCCSCCHHIQCEIPFTTPTMLLSCPCHFLVIPHCIILLAFSSTMLFPCHNLQCLILFSFSLPATRIAIPSTIALFYLPSADVPPHSTVPFYHAICLATYSLLPFVLRCYSLYLYTEPPCSHPFAPPCYSLCLFFLYRGIPLLCFCFGHVILSLGHSTLIATSLPYY
jgi:hypothetical protein